MLEAGCACGSLSAEGAGTVLFIVACHCRACQQRSGSPLGAGLYCLRADVETIGEHREYARSTESGGTLRNHFCPRCGSTVWWTIDARPDLVGIAIGAVKTPVPEVPILSLWERSRHAWITLVGAAEHHAEGAPS